MNKYCTDEGKELDYMANYPIFPQMKQMQGITGKKMTIKSSCTLECSTAVYYG